MIKAKEDRADGLFRPLCAPEGPGLAVDVSYAGRRVFSRGYGLADLEQGAAVTPQTVFHVASVSKQFTCFAVALLERAGQVDLEADVRSYLPYVPQLGHVVTVNHLVHNTSGLRDQWALFDLGGQSQDNRLRQSQVISMVSRQRALNFVPGREFLYSNTNFTLLAEIVRVVSGLTLRQFTAKYMFEPLGMSRTFFNDDVTELVRNRAHSYVPGPEGKGWRRALLNYDNVGATSLHTTSEDLQKWADNFRRPKVGDAALLEKVCASGRLSDGTPINYAHGLWRHTYGARPAIEHSGADAGFRSWWAYFPRHELGVVILTNYPFEDFVGLISAVVDIYVHDSATPALPKLPPASKDPTCLQALAGLYVADYAPLVTLEANGQDLRWRSVGMPTKRVVYREDGTFDLGDATNRFYRCYQPSYDADGRVSGFADISTRLGGMGHVTTSYRRVQLPVLADAQLAEFAGDYRNSELDITYSFSVDQGRLLASCIWSPVRVGLIPTLPDRFDGDSPQLPIVQFTRDSRGRIVGLVVHGGRIRHVSFALVVPPPVTNRSWNR